MILLPSLVPLLPWPFQARLLFLGLFRLVPLLPPRPITAGSACSLVRNPADPCSASSATAAICPDPTHCGPAASAPLSGERQPEKARPPKPAPRLPEGQALESFNKCIGNDPSEQNSSVGVRISNQPCSILSRGWLCGGGGGSDWGVPLPEGQALESFNKCIGGDRSLGTKSLGGGEDLRSTLFDPAPGVALWGRRW
ncbi:hypothetical protein EDC01DRAFT_632576 [Geopyxis carbonaria]|nr:hypothetical protein EDC01DRAFT_632576 [Geopyxis carbonaria]